MIGHLCQPVYFRLFVAILWIFSTIFLNSAESQETPIWDSEESEESQEPQNETSLITSGLSISSPYKTIGKTRQLLNTIGARILLLMNYTQQDRISGSWKTGTLPGLEIARYFSKTLAEGEFLTIEIAVLSFPEGGYEYYVFGQQISPDGSMLPNPDLFTIETKIQDLVSTILTKQQTPSAQQIGYQIYHLSYLQADRALAILKSLGFTTIEYSEQTGDSVYDRNYSPIQNGEWRHPVIIKMIDATKTSLMDPSPAGAYQQQSYGEASSATDLGGTFLHQMTSGEPQQRFLIVYNKNDPEPMEALLNLLREKIDRPARQIVIEALVIEVNTDKMSDLGISFRSVKGDYDVAFEKDPTSGDTPFTFAFNRNAFSDVLSFKTNLNAMLQSGDAEILSSPSVLVLDGRQARIQVGQQVPVSKSVSTTSGYSAGVEYIQTGIVLNLRPRINEDGSEITMQVETIVSAVNEALSIETIGSSGQVLLAPRVDNRQVQTFVRVADNTPFIIGGLISTEQKERAAGIPILSQIPILGLPFKRKTTENIKREVIVVLTPHVAPLDEKSFSYVIPKDSDIFNAFGNLLFRNAYRVRDDDVFDLKFVYESNIFQNLLTDLRQRADATPGLRAKEPFSSLLGGEVPGEEIIVRRMLWEIIRKLGFSNHIDIDRIIVFEDRPDAPDSSGFQTAFINRLLEDRTIKKQNTLVLTFNASSQGTPQHPFVPPKAKIAYETLAKEPYLSKLMKGNRYLSDGTPNKWTVLLSEIAPPNVRGATGIEVLQGVLVLKRILALNRTLPLTIQEFRVGRQIIFPTEQDLQQRFHIIDKDAARFFFEVIQYYPEFERTFNRETRRIRKNLEALNK